MNEPARFVVKTEDDGTEVSAAAFGLGVATDHSFQAMPDLDLQPLAAAALLIDAVAFLGKNTFEAVLLRHFEQGYALLLVVIGIAERVPCDQDGSQFFLSLLERKLAPIVAVEIKQIECVVEHRNVGLSGSAAAAGTKPGALLHQAE